MLEMRKLRPSLLARSVGLEGGHRPTKVWFSGIKCVGRLELVRMFPNEYNSFDLRFHYILTRHVTSVLYHK